MLKLKKIFTTPATILSLCLLQSSTSHGFMRLSAAGVGNSTRISGQSGDVKLSGKPDGIGKGGGLLLELGGKVGVELGAFYMERNVHFPLTILGNTLDIKVSAMTLHFPVLIRFHPIPFMSFGLGGYYSKYRSASAAIIINGTTIASEQSIATGNDRGVTAAAGLRIPIGNIEPFVDGRYNYGLKKDAQVDEIQGLVGICSVL